MPKTWRIILSGSGGQGLGTGGKILAEAAIFQGLNAAQSQTYGARARGGLSQSEIIISSEEILFPLIEHPDLLIALSQKAYDINIKKLPSSGILIYDLDYVFCPVKQNTCGFQLVKKAREIFDEKGVAIMVLGVISRLFTFVRPENIQKAIEKNFSGELLQKNLQCFLWCLSLNTR